MAWFDKHTGLFSFLALIISGLVAFGGFVLYFKELGHSEGTIEVNIQSLNERLTKLESDYRIILSTLLSNNKAAIATVENSNIEPINKRNILQYLEKNSQQIKQHLKQGNQPQNTISD